MKIQKKNINEDVLKIDFYIMYTRQQQHKLLSVD